MQATPAVAEWVRRTWPRPWVLGLAVATACALTWLAAQSPWRPAVPAPTQDPPRYTVARTVRYRFVVSNESTAPVAEARFWAYAPLPVTSTQRVAGMEVSVDYEVARDASGHQVMRFRVGALPPRGSRTVAVTVRMEMAAEPNRESAADLNRQGWLGPAPAIETEAAPIRELAARLRGVDARETARATAAWVSTNIRPAGYLREARGALYALRERQGDCTESAALFAALARANGIAARVLGGYVVGGDALLRARDYHNWAEFRMDGRWYLADPQRRLFMDAYADYLAFQAQGGENGGERLGAPRFGSESERVRVVMH